jgi:hypothetical protein
MGKGKIWVKKILMGMGRIWIKKILMYMDMKIPPTVPYPTH